MAHDSGLPHSHQESGFDASHTHALNTSPSTLPLRSGRLAMCTAAAGALALGVLGTLAYGVWFDHDQRAYGEAIASVRQTLGMSVSATESAVVSKVDSGAEGSNNREAAIREPAIWAGQIARAPAEASAQIVVANTASDLTVSTDTASTAAPSPAFSAAAPTTPPPPPHATRRAATSTAAGQPPFARRQIRDAHDPQADRRASTVDARHNNGLFARMGEFFRRVNYRQHDSGRQQPDLYSHP